MPPLPLLKHPASYRPCADDMLTDIPYRDYWLAHFASHFEVIVRLAIDNYGPAMIPSVHACRDDLIRELNALRQNPARHGPLNLLVLDMLRQEKLHAHNIPDPFEKMKRRENAAMLLLYPALIAELDAHPSPADHLLLLIEGIFAGNIFDLGAGATSQRFATESVDFLQIRGSLSRPWLIDHFDPFARRILAGPPYKKALFFCDNAGSDCILGVLPFVRWMAAQGATVVLAANHLPALNDITCTELRALAVEVARLDPLFSDLLANGKILIVDSGGTAPLIDLSLVSPETCAHAADCDILFLEGMGRGLESNFDAQFTVDAVKLCMIKEQIVADRHGGKLYDTVFRFDPAG